MKVPSLTTCLLLGALGSSLAFNVKTVLEARHSPAIAEAIVVASSCCSLVSVESPSSIELSDTQIEELAAQCGESCDRSAELERAAMEKHQALWRAVANPATHFEAVHVLLEETLDLRSRSLRECVDTALEVRSSLPSEWVRNVFEQCHAKCAARFLESKPKE